MGMQTKRLFGLLWLMVGMVFWTGCGLDNEEDNSGGTGGGGCKGIISFDANGGLISPSSINFSDCNEEIILPIPTRGDHMFDYWYLYQGEEENYVGLGGDIYMASQSQTMYAKWYQLRLTFNANGGRVIPSFMYLQSLKETIVLPTPTREDYIFDGWYSSSSVSGGTYYGAGGDSYTFDIERRRDRESVWITGFVESMVARWIKGVISFDANGGTLLQTEITVHPNMSQITLPVPTRDGYVFNGWYSSVSDGERYGDGGYRYTFSGSLTMYAQWTELFVITFDANGGLVSPVSLTEISGTEITLPTPTRSGYVFNGWYSSASERERYGDGGDSYTVSGSLTMYAQWTEGVVITFDANGGSVSTTYLTVLPGTEITLPTSTRSTWEFAGWYSSTSGGTLYGGRGDSYIADSSLTMYAQWTPSIIGAWGIDGRIMFIFYPNGRYDDILTIGNPSASWSNEYRISGGIVLTRSCMNGFCGTFSEHGTHGNELRFSNNRLYFAGVELTRMVNR